MFMFAFPVNSFIYILKDPVENVFLFPNDLVLSSEKALCQILSTLKGTQHL